MIAFSLGLLGGLGLGWFVCRNRGYEHGFNDGERHGKTTGYRQAWLRQHEPPFRRAWKDACDDE